MLHRRNLADKRQTTNCAYCGGDTKTRDHVPSKIFLDEPYPPDLPVVPCCEKCNREFSLHEEYVACLIECALVGSVKPEMLKREKIRRVLRNKPTLAARLARAQNKSGGKVIFFPEHERIKNVVLKLARGHILFEMNIPVEEEPISINIASLLTMSNSEITHFETRPRVNILPEIGSRASDVLFINGNQIIAPWIVVQPNRYRYLTALHLQDEFIVRIVFSEYLLCEIIVREF